MQAIIDRLFPWRPLPPFRQPDEIFASSSAALLPPRRMRVSEAAERHMVISRPDYHGPWKGDEVPYMREPMDCARSRDVEAVIFVGPAQSAKTKSLIEGVFAHAVTCDPLDMMIVQMSEVKARDFSLTRLEETIRLSPEIRARKSPLKAEDNVFDKRFAGMTLRIGWPVASQLSGHDTPLMLITDYDRMPANVGGEGSVFKLASARPRSFGSLGMVVAESSPKAVYEGRWQPEGHMAPPVSQGILSLYNLGDRRRFYWQCPDADCGEWFEPTFDRLDYRDDMPPVEAAEKVVMVCPHCGGLIEERHKRALNLSGVWLREGETIDRFGQRGGDPRRSPVASFWMFGPAAAFQRWGQLVRKVLEAKELAEKTGNDAELMGAINLDVGDCYLREPPGGEDALDPDAIRARAEPTWNLGTVPDGVRSLVVTVDVQGNWFDVQVTGYGPQFEGWVIHREQISQVGERKVGPGSYLEDWDLLTPLVDRAYPLASDPSRGMKPLCMVVDSGGAPGVTGNAYAWLLACRRDGIGEDRLMLLKGDAHVGNRRIALDKVDFSRGGKVLARGRKVLKVGTDTLKDDVAAALQRIDHGAGYLHTPADLPADWYAQATAEVRDSKGRWHKTNQGSRNEALDHLVYSRAALLRPPYRWDGLNWSHPPGWADVHERNTRVMPLVDTPHRQVEEHRPTQATPTRAENTSVRRKVGRSSYLSRIGR